MIFAPNNILIYTDASCSYEKKISACGYVILRDGQMIKHEVLLVENVGTPDEAELYAICFALKLSYSMPMIRRITVNTDSLNIHTQWLRAPDEERFTQLEKLRKKIQNKGILFAINYVKGHRQNRHNNLIDQSCRKILRTHLKGANN